MKFLIFAVILLPYVFSLTCYEMRPVVAGDKSEKSTSKLPGTEKEYKTCYVAGTLSKVKKCGEKYIEAIEFGGGSIIAPAKMPCTFGDHQFFCACATPKCNMPEEIYKLLMASTESNPEYKLLIKQMSSLRLNSFNISKIEKDPFALNRCFIYKLRLMNLEKELINKYPIIIPTGSLKPPKFHTPTIFAGAAMLAVIWVFFVILVGITAAFLVFFCQRLHLLKE